MNDNEKLRQIDEAVSAYAAGAANAGNPDAVIGEVARILEGLDPTPGLVRGLEQSAAGDVVDLGDFTQYVDDGEIRVGDVWDYSEYPDPHTVLFVDADYVSVDWFDRDPIILTREYFLRTRRLVSREGS